MEESSLAEHVVIRREDYVAGSRERPEVGIFTQTHAVRPPVPWGRVAPGEIVWMKWSGGPVVATARVSGFRHIENATPDALRAATAGFRLHDLEAYWAALPPSFFGLAVYLADEEWLDEPFAPGARSYGESWVVVDTPKLRAGWLTAGPEEPMSAARSGRGRSRTIPASLRFQVLRRDGFACTYCGRRPPGVVLHVDHVHPWVSGGPTDMANLRTACADCNLGKGARKLA